MRRAKRSEHLTRHLLHRRPAQVDQRHVVAFEPLPSNRVGARIDDCQIVLFLVDDGQQQVHRAVAYPASGFQANVTCARAEDVLLKTPCQLFGERRRWSPPRQECAAGSGHRFSSGPTVASLSAWRHPAATPLEPARSRHRYQGMRSALASTWATVESHGRSPRSWPSVRRGRGSNWYGIAGRTDPQTPVARPAARTDVASPGARRTSATRSTVA